jgi:hypothetical protein
MSYLIAKGNANDLDQLGRYQSSFPENSRGLLSLELNSPVSTEVASWTSEVIQKAGVPSPHVETDGNKLNIFFKTKIPPLAIIAIAIGTSIFILMMVVSWKLYRLDPLPALTLSIGVAVLVLVGIPLLVYILRRKAFL